MDVVFLQETHSDDKNAVEWLKEWNGLSFLSHNTSLSGGVCILFDKKFVPNSVKMEENIK